VSVYFCAFIRVHDDALYARYLEGTDAALAGTGGEVLAVDPAPVVLEGAPCGGRAVLVRFPDEAAFRGWYESEVYRRIAAIRYAASEGDALLVKGRPGPEEQER